MKLPMKLTPTEYGTVVWHLNSPAGQTIEDILKPEYWQHVTRQLRPGHEIKVSSEDRTMWAHLLVRDVGKMEAKVAVIHKVEFGSKEDAEIDADAGADDAEFKVKWRSPASKYGVFRASDEECMQDGFETKEAAAMWIAERAKSMAA